MEILEHKCLVKWERNSSLVMNSDSWIRDRGNIWDTKSLVLVICIRVKVVCSFSLDLSSGHWTGVTICETVKSSAHWKEFFSNPTGTSLPFWHETTGKDMPVPSTPPGTSMVSTLCLTISRPNYRLPLSNLIFFAVWYWFYGYTDVSIRRIILTCIENQIQIYITTF